MNRLNQLLANDLQDLMSVENQLLQALPKMAQAAHHPKLRETIEKHLEQTRNHVQRLNTAFEMLGAGEKAQAKPEKGIAGIIQQGEQRIEALRDEDDLVADLGLIAAAQKAEHYEISAYGTARYVARQTGQLEIAKLLSQTLGEEESADYLLTEIAKPILQDATAEGVTEQDNRTVTSSRARAQRA